MDPYVGEIRLFAGTYEPRDWAFCDGRELPIQQYSLLFSVIGNQFGGDGVTTFKLPDMRGRVPMQQGTGPGLTDRPFASNGGSMAVTLEENQMPVHTHAANAVTTQTVNDPTSAVWANSIAGRLGVAVYSPTPAVTMNPLAIGSTGGNQPHNNAQPYLMINFIIALQGIFPNKP
jgi:microcystin-dependent protein